MKEEISKAIKKAMEENNVSEYQIIKLKKIFSINVLNAILQKGKFKGKGYNIDNLTLLLKYLEVKTLTFDFENQKVEITYQNGKTKINVEPIKTK